MRRSNGVADFVVGARDATELRQTAETFVGEPVKNVVVTVPAYFSDAQRQVTGARACCA